MNKKRIFFALFALIFLAAIALGAFFLIKTLEKNQQKEFLAKNSYIEEIANIEIENETTVLDTLNQIAEKFFQAKFDNPSELILALSNQISNNVPPESLSKEYNGLKISLELSSNYYREVYPYIEYLEFKNENIPIIDPINYNEINQAIGSRIVDSEFKKFFEQEAQCYLDMSSSPINLDSFLLGDGDLDAFQTSLIDNVKKLKVETESCKAMNTNFNALKNNDNQIFRIIEIAKDIVHLVNN